MNRHLSPHPPQSIDNARTPRTRADVLVTHYTPKEMGSLYQCKKSKLTTRKLCRKSQGLCYYYICRTTVVSNAERGRASRWSCCSVLGAKSAPSARRNFHFRDYRILNGSWWHVVVLLHTSLVRTDESIGDIQRH